MPPRNFSGQFSDWPSLVTALVLLFLFINIIE